MADATVRIQPLGGVWETLGSDRLRGIVPEGIEASCNDWGPDTLNFALKAEDGARRPDVLPYTPVDLQIDGMLCWSGFVWTRPSDANGYSVGCRGWQYHLDDDLLDRAYVHTRLGDYVDYRSLLSANLATGTQAGTISVDSGAISLGFPNAAVLAAGMYVGVTFDAGLDSTFIRAVLSAEASFNAGLLLYVMGHSNPNWEDGVGRLDYLSGQPLNAAPWTAVSQAKTFSATIGAGRRYTTVFVYAGAGATLAADVWVKIRSLQLFRDASYESGGASAVTAYTVIQDVLGAAPLLSQNKNLLTLGTFAIPEYLTRGYLSPRQIAEAVNAYENYRLKIGAADLKTLVFDPKPATPLFEVGDWSGAEFSDATISGEPIYSRAITDATGPDGARLVSKRTQSGTLVDRRGITRSIVLPINSAVTQAVADRFADLWLAEHRTAPFSGRLVVTGNATRRVSSGVSVPAHELLLAAGEKIRLSNRIDPDTGAWGRDGRIAGVTYRHDARQAEIAIDDQRDRFDKVLSRYGVLVDQLG